MKLFMLCIVNIGVGQFSRFWAIWWGITANNPRCKCVPRGMVGLGGHNEGFSQKRQFEVLEFIIVAVELNILSLLPTRPYSLSLSLVFTTNVTGQPSPQLPQKLLKPNLALATGSNITIKSHPRTMKNRTSIYNC